MRTALMILAAFTGVAAMGSRTLAQPKLDTKAMEEIDGRKLPPDKQFPRTDVVQRFRPWVPEHENGTIEVGDLKIHHVTNQKAIDIGLVSTDRVPGKTLCFKKVVVRNCEISDVIRDEEGQKRGLHIDFLRVCGGGDNQPIETELVIEDIFIHDGTALPIIVQDGKFSSITLRRVRIENTTLGVQIAFINTGYAKQVIVEDSPGLRVALMGRPGTIEKCVVRNSPGASANDVQNVNGRSGVKITEEGVGAQRINNDTPATKKAATGTASTETAPPTTAPVAANQPLKLTLTGDKVGEIEAMVNGTMPENVAMVIFEAYDTDDYRVAVPVLVTEAPWQAKLAIKKPGKTRIEARIRKVGGNEEAALMAMVDIRQ